MMGIAAGSLDQRVTILQNMALVDPENSRDEMGQLIDDWQPFLTSIHANVLFKNGSQFISQSRVEARGVASVRIRYRTTINAGMRVVHKGVTYKMLAPPLISKCRTYMDLPVDTITPETES